MKPQNKSKIALPKVYFHMHEKMASISLEILLQESEKYIPLAQQGGIFVYPTDTIYGLGAIVTAETIEKIDTIKQRGSGKHYSIIAPSFAWIEEHFDVGSSFELERVKRKKQFPGRGLTLILPLQNNSSPLTLLSPTQTIGVRIIDHPFQQFVANLGEPFITTSCNVSGDTPIKSVEDLPLQITKNIDLIIDGGVLGGDASVVIDYKSGNILRA